MLFSMIHLSVQITPQPPHHRRRCNQVLLVILFKLQIFFLEQFCDLQLKRNEFFLIHPSMHPHTSHIHMYHKSPHPQSLVRAGLLSSPMLFASLHNFHFCYSAITRIAAFQAPLPFPQPPPPFYHHKCNIEILPRS